MASPTLDRVLDAVFRVDASFNVLFLSEPGQHWLGCANAAEIPKTFIEVMHPEDVERFKTTCHDSPDAFTCDVRVIKSGTELWVNVRGYPISAVHQFVLCIFDISRWKTDEAVFRHAAEHDNLTGLPNRAFLKGAVDRMLKSEGSPFCVALLDLDGFKKVNDTYGHAIGDAVLIETSKRLLKVIGPQDILARLGGDEFVLVLHDKTAAAAKDAMTSVLFAIARPYDAAPHNAYLGVSIGVAEYPAHGTDYSILLKNADTAMYHAKNAGKNRVSVFQQTSESVDFSINAAIHNGIEEGEFYMEFQPQFDIQRNIIGAESLMRWTSRDFGRVGPDQFIPIAEEAGLMPFLGKWALRYSCHQLREFQQFKPDFVMSVNVSPVQFGGDDFDTQVLEVIAQARVEPKHVILEITESTLMHSQAKTERALANLRDKGVRFSIDDFGTGFSSLAYLTRLPVSSIKIDKAFVRAIEHPSSAKLSDKKLIAAMIDLAHSIDLRVVAEGVENEEQFAFLKESGCNLIQGYLLGKPMSADAMRGILNAPRQATA
jgi:diguanylate cyclase (GGDEF)-like protein